MNFKTHKFYLFTSPIYIAAVGLLLLNDFVLKQSYHCWLTGKLSDFAGLFAFSVFVLVVWPKKLPWFGVALSFLIWKPPLSEPLIATWNAVTGLRIGRTIDYTDLIAIAVIPLAWIFCQSWKPTHIRIEWCLITCGISLFAFAATTRAPTPEQRAAFAAAVADYSFTEHQPTYVLPFTRRELYQRIEALGFRVSGSTGLFPISTSTVRTSFLRLFRNGRSRESAVRNFSKLSSTWTMHPAA